MRTRTLIALLAMALAAAGCATTGAPGPQASADSRECKVVAVYSASDVLRNQNARGVPGSEAARADGAAESGRIAANAQLRTPSRLDSATSRIVSFAPKTRSRSFRRRSMSW